MKVKDITNYLEEIAPISLQEGYDNSGLIVGNPDAEIQQILICLDSIEAVVDEAIQKRCQMILAHHPIVFKGLKKFNGANYVEKVVMKAIKHDIAIYAIHTNLDNVLSNGVNEKFAEKLQLSGTEVLLAKKGQLKKLIVFVPESHAEDVRRAVGEAGAGRLGNYDFCSYESKGEGRFRGNVDSKPFAGEPGKLHSEPEQRLEVLFPAHLQKVVIEAMLVEHPYEEPAYDIIPTENIDKGLGSGLIGELEKPMSLDEFLSHLKLVMRAEVIRFAKARDKMIKRVAICGGSGSFLLGAAKSRKADVFVTGDFKYHEFFDGENQLHICDIGHYESEQFTIELLGGIINKKFPNFAVLFTESSSNPVNYYY
jgi:dinuclear metal center YbgI/SA1388 family protein